MNRSHTRDIMAIMAEMDVVVGLSGPHSKSRNILGTPQVRGLLQIFMMLQSIQGTPQVRGLLQYLASKDLFETLKDTKGNGFKDLTL